MPGAPEGPLAGPGLTTPGTSVARSRRAASPGKLRFPLAGHTSQRAAVAVIATTVPARSHARGTRSSLMPGASYELPCRLLHLPGKPDRLRQELHERSSPPTNLRDSVHEVGAAGRLFGEGRCHDEVLSLQVLDEGVVRVVAAGWALELFAPK